jgi:hypothetical protein
MTIRTVDETYRTLRRRYTELELRRMTPEELAEWYSVSAEMTVIELDYPDGFYRPIAMVENEEDYDLQLRLADGYSAAEQD